MAIGINYANQVAQGPCSERDTRYPSPPEIRPVDTVQAQCADNTEKIRSINRMLGAVRGKLFGEFEPTKDLDKSSPTPSLPCVIGALHVTNDGFSEAFAQLESILARL